MKFLEKPYVVIPFILLVALGVFLNVALKAEPEKAGEHPKTEVATEEKKEATTSTAFNGEEIYKNTCIGCHGDQYQGMVGPKLTGLSKKYKEEDVAKILEEGKGTGMPGGLVAGKEKDMAKWLLTLE